MLACDKETGKCLEKMLPVDVERLSDAGWLFYPTRIKAKLLRGQEPFIGVILPGLILYRRAGQFSTLNKTQTEDKSER